METIEVPDIWGKPRRLWRAWQMWLTENEQPSLLLGSINQRGKDGQPYSWTPRQIMKAECTIVDEDKKHSPDETPKDGCTCGIHALNSPLWLAKIDYVSCAGPGRDHLLWGEIDLWGRLIEGTTGIKAQFGYPAQFLIRWDAQLSYFGKNHEIVKLDAFLIRDILRSQWGVPARVVRTAVREPKPGLRVIFSDEPEPER